MRAILTAAACVALCMVTGCINSPGAFSPVLSANLNLYNRGGTVASGATDDSKDTTNESLSESAGGGALRVDPSTPAAVVN